MSGFKRLLIVALGIFCVSTASYADDRCATVDQNRRLESLQKVYYDSGKRPPDASTDEINELRRLKTLPDPDLKDQIAFLNAALPGNENLQAIAIRDQDHDGIKDYRITICGEFRENDPDVDCDGVANVLDDSPYDAVQSSPSSCDRDPDWHHITNDHNGNGLPDQIERHLSGSASADEKQAAELRAALYRDYKIALVDRRTPMPAKMVIELDHVIREIFRGQIQPDFEPLRVIATDIAVCPGETAEDSEEDFYGWTSPENSTIILTSSTVELKTPILRLEILVHEITHTLQYALDFTPEDVRGFRTRNLYLSDGFNEFAATLGWTAVRNSSGTGIPDPLAVTACGSSYPFTVEYLGKKGTEWQAEWDQDTGPGSPQVSANPELKAEHMFSWYAFDSAWEWHAEINAALVLNKLLAAAGRICTSDEAAALRERLHIDLDDAGWGYVNENAIGLAAYETVITRQFHVTNNSWDALARFFLLGSYRGICSG